MSADGGFREQGEREGRRGSASDKDRRQDSSVRGASLCNILYSASKCRWQELGGGGGGEGELIPPAARSLAEGAEDGWDCHGNGGS